MAIVFNNLSASGSSGANVAKLVATGTLNMSNSSENFLSYNLTKPLEANKIYFVVRYDDGIGLETSSSFLIIKEYGGGYIKAINGTSIMVFETVNDTLVTAIITYTHSFENHPAIIEIINHDYPLYFSENDYVEIYELPFTLGGNE